jgi:hemerythrin-like domain-containing protein
MIIQEKDLTISLSDDDKDKLKSMLIEMTHRLERIEQEKDAKDEIANIAVALFGLKKKHLNRLAATMYKRNFKDLQDENTAFEFLYEALMEEN